MPNLLSTEERMASWSIVSILLGFTWCVFQECSVLHIFLQFQSVHPIFSSPSGVCACRSKQLADHQNILLWWEYILFVFYESFVADAGISIVFRVPQFLEEFISALVPATCKLLQAIKTLFQFTNQVWMILIGKVFWVPHKDLFYNISI